jgi:hypothetical protein
MLGGDVVGSEQLQSIGEVDHFRDRRRFFKGIVAEREGNPRYLSVEARVCRRCAASDNLGLPFWCRMFDPYVQTASPNGIS